MTPDPLTVHVIRHGLPGHLCVASRCCFHIHDVICIGDVEAYRVSSVGCYHPGGLDNATDENREEIGVGRLYETFVFDIRVNDLEQIDSLPANSNEEAEANHAQLLEKWLRRAGEEAS